MTETFESAEAPRKKEKSLFLRLASLRFFAASTLVHMILIMVLGGTIIFHAATETPDFTAGSDGIVADAVDAQKPPGAPEMEKPADFKPTAPSVSPPLMAALTTTAVNATTMNVASIPSPQAVGISDSMKSAISSLDAGGAMGAGDLGAMGRMGGARVNFFGVKTTAKRMAFLVDYSGSMDGPFRLEMEKELEKTLKTLPTNTQVLIIPWSGGAWLYNQLATEIKDKWIKHGDEYDNFELKRGEKLKKPEWVTIGPDAVNRLMKGVLAQEKWQGGTDWRQPFSYVMEVNPLPDTIFFMTDGQIQNVDRALSSIDKSLRKTPTPPTVFALWIKNDKHDPAPMKELAKRYKGEFREVGGKR